MQLIFIDSGKAVDSIGLLAFRFPNVQNFQQLKIVYIVSAIEPRSKRALKRDPMTYIHMPHYKAPSGQT